MAGIDSPCREHLNQMLLCASTALLALSEPTEDAILVQQGLASRSLDIGHLAVGSVRRRWNAIEVQVLAEYYNAGAVVKHCVARRLDGNSRRRRSGVRCL